MHKKCVYVFNFAVLGLFLSCSLWNLTVRDSYAVPYPILNDFMTKQSMDNFIQCTCPRAPNIFQSECERKIPIILFLSNLKL